MVSRSDFLIKNTGLLNTVGFPKWFASAKLCYGINVATTTLEELKPYFHYCYRSVCSAHLILFAEKTVWMIYSNSWDRTGTARQGWLLPGWTVSTRQVTSLCPVHYLLLWIIWILLIVAKRFCTFPGDFWALWAMFLSQCPGNPVGNNGRWGQRQDWGRGHSIGPQTIRQDCRLARQSTLRSQVHPARPVGEDSRAPSKVQAHLGHGLDNVWVLGLGLRSWATGRGCWWGASWTRRSVHTCGALFSLFQRAIQIRRLS